MLRKRSRSNQKHQMVRCLDSYPGQAEFSRFKNHKNGSLFSIPSLLEGFSNKGSSDSDSSWSPTSPLDFRLFGGLGNPFAGSSKSVKHGHHKSFDSGKVGLSIVKSFEDCTDASGKGLRSCESKNILFGPGIRLGNPIYPNGVQNAHELNPTTQKDYTLLPQCPPKTLPKYDELSAIFEIGDDLIKQDPFCFLSSYGAMGSSGFPLKQSLDSHGGMNPVLESEIELSEDYTCVISHGPNPKTTHFYGDRILESLDDSDLDKGFCYKEQKDFTTVFMAVTEPPVPANFLSFCASCKKGLHGEDLYLYRGYITFCSDECRSKEILADENMDEAAVAAKSVVSDRIRKDHSEKKKSGKGGVIFTVGSRSL